MNYLDLTTASLDLVTTYLYVIASIWMWPLTIITSLLNIYLFYQIGIYGDSGMALFYAASSVYGWYNWNRGKREDGTIVVSTLTLKQGFILAMVVVSVIGVLGYILKTTVHSTVPYLDAMTTTLSVTSQWLFCKKKIETWVLWFVADLIYLILYFYKGVPCNGMITFVYLYMAVIGYVRWSRLLVQERPVLAVA